MPSLSTAEDVRAQWLATLQRLFAGVAHDVKDSLNGVSVNLEVVRSRSGKAEVQGSAIAPFAAAAGQQLERLTTLIEAMLAVGRSEREPVDVGVTLGRVAALCGASASPDDARVELDDVAAEAATTSLGGDIVRLALTAPLLDLVVGRDRGTRAAPVRCTLRVDRDGVVVTMAAAGRRATMPLDAGDALRAAGVRWTEGEQGNDELSLVFPRP